MFVCPSQMFVCLSQMFVCLSHFFYFIPIGYMFVCLSHMFVCPSHIQTNIILYQGYEGNLVKKQDEQTNRKSHYLGTFSPRRASNDRRRRPICEQSKFCINRTLKDVVEINIFPTLAHKTVNRSPQKGLIFKSQTIFE